MANFVQLFPIVGFTPLWLKLLKSRIPAAHLEQRNGVVYVRDTDVEIDRILGWADGGITYWISRIGSSGKLRKYKERSITMQISNVDVVIDSLDASLIAWDVFCGGEYVIEAPWKDAVVVDVGMNLGFAALCFLSRPWCKHVYGFEPSGSTFARAQKNLAMNPQLAARCTSMNFGLGADNGRVTLYAAEGNSGNASMVPGDVSSQTFNETSEEVEIRRADAELAGIYTQIGPDIPVILKMDCEGAESQIFSVFTGDLIRRLSVVLLEWHSQEILLDIQDKLTKNGFVSYVDKPSADCGMLRAVNVAHCF